MPRSIFGRRACALALPLVTLLALGCGSEGEALPENAAASPEGEGARWVLSEAPLVELGVVAGEKGHQLSRVKGALKLGDGRLVVLDGDSKELRFFSPEGKHLVSTAGEGAGPGEFRSPAVLRRGPGDTLRVYDMAARRFSFFSPDGTFVRTDAEERADDAQPEPGADPFGMDTWVLGWNWIESPLPPEERGGVVEALARMSAPDTALGARLVLVTEQGLIWTTSPVPPADRPSLWRVHLPNGDVLATLEMPARFTPTEVTDGWVVGVYLDPLDVEFVRLYEVDRAGSRSVAPGLAALMGKGPAVYPSIPDDAYEELRQAMRMVASHQEIGYSKAMSYSGDVDRLAIPADKMPQGIRIELMMADDRGWAGIFLHPASGAGCAIGYGATMPPGWRAGSIVCPGR